MQKYPEKIGWQKKVSEDLLSCFGKTVQKNIKKFLFIKENLDFEYKIERVSDEFFDWFLPEYKSFISSTENPLEIDVKNHIISRPNIQYYYLAVYQKEIPLGAMIYSVRQESLSIAFRYFKHNWLYGLTDITPSYIAEYIIGEEAFKLKKKIINHGIDRNLYGMNANIGLATYKLSIGCYPILPKDSTVKNIDLSSLNREVFVMLCENIREEKYLQSAALVIDKQNQQKYAQLKKYAERILDLKIIIR